MPPTITKSVETEAEYLLRNIECSNCGRPIDWKEKRYRGSWEIEVDHCKCLYQEAYDDGIEDGREEVEWKLEEEYHDGYNKGYEEAKSLIRPTIPSICRIINEERQTSRDWRNTLYNRDK